MNDAIRFEFVKLGRLPPHPLLQRAIRGSVPAAQAIQQNLLRSGDEHDADGENRARSDATTLRDTLQITVRPARMSVSIATGTLANACVAEFDHFRAPMTPAERDRRLKSRLSPAETVNLERWGYPHVFETFRFHMTLTGPLASDEQPAVASMLQSSFEHAGLDHPVRIDTLTLLRQESLTRPFLVTGQWPLAAPTINADRRPKSQIER